MKRNGFTIMIQIYECDDGASIYWEIWNGPIAGAGTYFYTLDTKNELELYLDVCRAKGVDFVINTLEEYWEYHLALENS